MQRTEEKYLTFEAGGLYAVPICRVREILNNTAGITPVPGFPSYARGIIQLRGDVVPVIDLRRRFGVEEPASFCVVVMENEMTDEPVGFAVDRVCAVEDMLTDDIKKPPRLIKGADYIEGVCRKDDALVLILSPERLVTKEFMDAVGSALKK